MLSFWKHNSHNFDQSTQNFVLKESMLLKMLRKGGWILLDGVDSAPHKVERLMPLLEKNPTLSIYEGVPPIIFYSSGSHFIHEEKGSI
jgi:hypothetical protein